MHLDTDKNLSDLHEQAMEFADQAEIARRQGDAEEYRRLIGAAYAAESEAAWALVGELEFEPTRSVMFRSAASLAIEAGKIRDAEQLISAGLAGTPSDEIADELATLFEMHPSTE